MLLFARKILKYTTYFLLGNVVFVGGYLLVAFCFSRIAVNQDNVKIKKEIAIYIKTNGVHTDIVVPTKHQIINWSSTIPYSNTTLNDTTMAYLALGWGDKGFYLETPTWADLKVSTAFNAAFALGTTALHATYYAQMTENESCKKIIISNVQYVALTQYILNSLQLKNNSAIYIKTTANYGNTDAFYEANGSYSMLHTCNTWANNALKACGQKACLWTPFDTGIFLKYN